MIITIDGPASVGKGTLARKVSEFYNFAYFDTGMIYRAVGLISTQNGINLEDENAVLEVAENLTFQKMLDVSKDAEFRSSQNGVSASKVAALANVRLVLLKMQRDFAQNPTLENGEEALGVVFDGRDTGTVVCPNANVKFFITARPEVRAQRRYNEFMLKGVDISYETVLKDVIERDERDMNRSVAPLRPADDAIILDTSDVNAQEVFEIAKEFIER